VPAAIWIAWENQIRNQSLSGRLGVELHVLSSKRTRFVRYAVCVSSTVILILMRRPSVVFAPNPSIVLTYLLMLLKYVFGYTFVTDAHYAGIMAPNGNRLFQKALDFCNRRADLVIATNEEHGKHVEAVGGRALVCEDPLPDVGRYARNVSEQAKKVFFICSFDIDEPYVDAFQAAKLLQEEGYAFWVSGNFGKVGIVPAEWPHVRFLGYVPEADFYSHLAESQVVVDLTTQENCLVCGAYEAMVLEKPLVTSKTSALQKYFTGGTVFVDHDSDSIANGVRLAFEKRVELKRQIEQWKKQITADNARKIEAIRAVLNLA
jgi:glycosyltransferase involved in cell wall biosynthesis